MRRLMKVLLLSLFLAATAAAGPRKYILELRDMPARHAVPRLAADAPEVHVRHEFALAFRGVAVELEEGESLDELARLPYVARIHPDTPVYAHADGTTSQRIASRRRMHAGGNGVVVAVVDTGIDHTHPALAGKVIGGWDFVNNDNDPMDDAGHGTHVAGIIAAESAEVTGVATGVRLLAYKVLDAHGDGTTSTIMAGIERAMDPNRDGNFSDRADIINLSLGGPGRFDDPLAQAVENAVARGIVVCVSAGNEGSFHRIGTPASAPSAITVGATGQAGGLPVLADFSSRGPATGSGAVKPDLVAPGDGILSTVLDHGFDTKTGTSMSTPYVSGLAALVLEQHPQWTPARVKAALVATALPLDGEEVMSQGSGMANGPRAIANDVVLTPTQLNFGLDAMTTPSFAATRRVQLRNEATSARTIRLRADALPNAVAMTITPSEVTLAAGQSRDVDVTIGIDHTQLGDPPTLSLAFGGTLLLELDGDALRLPWAFLRAGRATIRYAGAEPTVSWTSETPGYGSAARFDFGVEVLVKPGTYDFAVAAQNDGDYRVIVAENKRIEGDVSLSVSSSQAPLEVRLEGIDENGDGFTNGNGVNTLRSKFVRLLLRDTGSLDLPGMRTLRVSPFSERFALLATEAFSDAAARKITIAQYPLLRGLVSNAVLRVAAGDYASQSVSISFPAGATGRKVAIQPLQMPRRGNEAIAGMEEDLVAAANDPVWTATLFMTPEVHADYASGVRFMATSDQNTRPPAIITPAVRRGTRGFFSVRGFNETPLPVGTVAGERIEFGVAPFFPIAQFRSSQTVFLGEPEFAGGRHETLPAKKRGVNYRVTNAAGVEIAAGTVGSGRFLAPLGGDPPYRAEFRLGDSLLTARFGKNATVPNLTSFAILDGVGRHTNRLAAFGNGAFVFSADRGVEARAFFRRRGSPEWVPLTAVTMDEDETAGAVYRVDLREALRLRGELDLAVEIANAGGDSLRWELAPALTAGRTKRRSVR
jgi:hypothetical protein